MSHRNDILFLDYWYFLQKEIIKARLTLPLGGHVLDQLFWLVLFTFFYFGAYHLNLFMKSLEPEQCGN